MESKPQPGLRRVEDALKLVKHHDALYYARVIHNLERIWVLLLPQGLACYRRSLNACVLDERFVLPETTRLEQIASAIVHEATHARLWRWGIGYDENARTRIEAICLRREMNFLAKLPHSESMRTEIARTLEWVVSDREYFSNVSLQQRFDQGQIEAMRYAGIPDWLINLALKGRAAISRCGVWQTVALDGRCKGTKSPVVHWPRATK